MASNITLSAGVRQNLLSLQNTADLMSKTQNRLATGKEVNSALDNPTNFFTSSALASRASDMGALLDNMTSGIKTLEAADNGLTSITSTVESMQSTLRQARQDKSFKTQSFTIDETTIGTGALKNLSFTGGAFGALSVSVPLNQDLANGVGTKTSGETIAAYAAPAAAAPATYTAAAAYAAPGANADLTISFGGGSVDVTLLTTDTTLAGAITKINNAITADANSIGKFEAYDNGGSLAIRSIGNVDGNVSVTGTGEAAVFGAQVTAAGSDGKTSFTVNGTAVELTSAESTVALAAAKVTEQLQGTGFEGFVNGTRLQIRATAAGTDPLTIGGTDAALFGAVTTGTKPASVKSVDEMVASINNNDGLKGKIRASNDNGKLRIENLSTQELTVTGVGSDGEADGTAGTNLIEGNAVRANLATQFNLLRDQLDKFADDASYNGINLLRGDLLKLTFNETGTSTIEIQAKDLDGNERPINTTTLGIDFVKEENLDSDASIDNLLNGLSAALGTLRSQSSNFGSNLSIVENRTNFTKSMINTLQTGADGLVLADTNEEAANMLALQTRQQLSSTALSMASQADQAVLRLFG